MTMTDKEALTEMQGDSALNKARILFVNEVGQLEQAEMQRQLPTSIERVKMQFAATKRIAAGLGVVL